MQPLIDAIRANLPAIVDEWNTVKLPLFESLVEKKFVDYFKGRQTQEKTKMVAPVLDSIFHRKINAVLPTFEVDEGKGRDYSYNNTPLECKITFGEGNGWVGNGYAKTPWHILLRFNLTDNGIITDMFAMMANLDECQSKWTAPGTSSNFSGLTFVKEDKDNLKIIVGSIKESRTYLKPVAEAV
jgi:hypothetical protein